MIKKEKGWTSDQYFNEKLVSALLMKPYFVRKER